MCLFFVLNTLVYLHHPITLRHCRDGRYPRLDLFIIVHTPLIANSNFFLTSAINSHGNPIIPVLFMHRARHKPRGGSSWGWLTRRVARARARENIDIILLLWSQTDHFRVGVFVSFLFWCCCIRLMELRFPWSHYREVSGITGKSTSVRRGYSGCVLRGDAFHALCGTCCLQWLVPIWNLIGRCKNSWAIRKGRRR